MTQTLLMPRSSDTLPRFEDEAGGIDPAGRVDDAWSTGAPDAVLDDLGLGDFARPAHNLPVPPTRMLNRVWEVETVRRLLGSEGVRLLTLVGPGGVGKTRLALAAAEILLDAFPDGAWFVHLAPLADSTQALSTIAAAIDSHPAEGRPSLEHLSRRLQGRRMLLVLDNCEQLLPGLAHDVGELLAACPGLSVLATSREPLRLRWEHRLPVPPLGLPDPADGAAPATLLRSPAVALFVERTRAIRPDFELTEENGTAVADLCRRLDGLPLAIELAAAHTDALPPAALLSRLERHLPLPRTGPEDAPERHRTLEAAIRWSYEQLGPAEQALLRRLALLSGSWGVDEAEAVADAPLGLDVLTAVLEVVDKGLLAAAPSQDDQPRFAMLQTVRAYATNLLEASGEAEELARPATAVGRVAEDGMARHVPSSRATPPRMVAGDIGVAKPDGDSPGLATDRSHPVQGSAADNPLSARERAVLRLVAEGLPSKQIGRELALAERTVKSHVTGAMNKLGAFTRAQAVALATQQGLLKA